MEILTEGSHVASFRQKVVVAIGVGSSGAVVLCQALCCSACSPKLSGDTLSCSERTKPEQGYTKYQRMLYGRAACFLPMCPTCAGCYSKPAVWCDVGEGTTCRRRRVAQAVGSFSQLFGYCLCFAVSVCLTTQGIVRICSDSRDCLCPVHRSAIAAPCDGDGGSVRYLLRISHKRKEPGGAEKHPQHPWKQEKFEKPQNEVQAPERQLGSLSFKSITWFLGP